MRFHRVRIHGRNPADFHLSIDLTEIIARFFMLLRPLLLLCLERNSNYINYSGTFYLAALSAGIPSIESLKKILYICY